MEESFCVFDKDGTGSLSAAEFKELVAFMRWPLTKESEALVKSVSGGSADQTKRIITKEIFNKWCNEQSSVIWADTVGTGGRGRSGGIQL